MESKVNERHRDHALFIAYAPAEKAKIALAVLVENGGMAVLLPHRLRDWCWTTSCLENYLRAQL